MVNGVAACELHTKSVELRLGIGDRYRRLQPGYDRVAADAALDLRARQTQGEKELDSIAEEVELLRHHADDRRRQAIEHHRLADDGAVGAVAAMPRPIAEHDHRCHLVGLILRIGECATEQWLST